MLGSFHRTQGFGEFRRTAHVSGRSEQPTAHWTWPFASAARILREALHEAFVAHHDYWQLRRGGIRPNAAIKRALGNHHSRNEVHGARRAGSSCKEGDRARNPRHLMRALAGTLVRRIGQSHQRRALAELDDRLLLDIGLTRQQAEREAAKPFWCADRA
jgi:uncharacterized protein YjiS (DUF1127 family)